MRARCTKLVRAVLAGLVRPRDQLGQRRVRAIRLGGVREGSIAPRSARTSSSRPPATAIARRRRCLATLSRPVSRATRPTVRWPPTLPPRQLHDRRACQCGCFSRRVVDNCREGAFGRVRVTCSRSDAPSPAGSPRTRSERDQRLQPARAPGAAGCSEAHRSSAPQGRGNQPSSWSPSRSPLVAELHRGCLWSTTCPTRYWRLITSNSSARSRASKSVVGPSVRRTEHSREVVVRQRVITRAPAHHRWNATRNWTSR